MGETPGSWVSRSPFVLLSPQSGRSAPLYSSILVAGTCRHRGLGMGRKRLRGRVRVFVDQQMPGAAPAQRTPGRRDASVAGTPPSPPLTHRPSTLPPGSGELHKEHPSPCRGVAKTLSYIGWPPAQSEEVQLLLPLPAAAAPA